MLGGHKSVHEFVKYLISINSDLVESKAICNCHCVGLNSFIINERPKIRLFVADKYCKLYDDFDSVNPIIPIHPHKYDDVFVQVSGTLIQHLYVPIDNSYQFNSGIEFNKYKYGRLSDNQIIENFGKQNLEYKGQFPNLEYLKSNQLHTVSLDFGIETLCSWLVFETFEDKEFKQVAYHKNLKEDKQLYKQLNNPIHYLNQHLDTLKHK